jgi:hypothetical protein
MSANIHALTITGAVMAALTYIVHMDLSRLGRSVNLGGALIGGAFFTVFVAFVCASSGWLYNHLALR